MKTFLNAIKKYFADYSTTIHSTGGEYIEFSKTETRAAYVKPGKITIQTTTKSNSTSATTTPVKLNSTSVSTRQPKHNLSK